MKRICLHIHACVFSIHRSLLIFLSIIYSIFWVCIFVILITRSPLDTSRNAQWATQANKVLPYFTFLYFKYKRNSYELNFLTSSMCSDTPGGILSCKYWMKISDFSVGSCATCVQEYDVNTKNTVNKSFTWTINFSTTLTTCFRMLYSSERLSLECKLYIVGMS